MTQAYSIEEVAAGITRFPVMIISSARCGSTVLYDQLIKHFPLIKAFNEPDDDKKTEFHEFLKFHDSSKQYITKIHSNNLLTPYEGKPIVYPEYIRQYLRYSPDVYRIRIRRKDLVAQIASLYVAKHRNVWRYMPGEVMGDKLYRNIDIIHDDLKIAIASVKHSFISYDMFDHIDCDVYYEDVKLGNADSVQTPRPANYNELIKLIQYMLK